MRLVLLGPPGSGKGTQATIIAGAFGVPHVSTGDLFREHVREGTELGRTAQDFMVAGTLVPDELVNAMVADRLGQADAGPGFLLDGFPRTVGQAEWLADLLAGDERALDCVLHFEVAEEELQARVAERLAREGRADDDAVTFLRRMEEYRGQTASLIPHYRELGLLRDVDAVGGIEEVTGRALAACQEAGS